MAERKSLLPHLLHQVTKQLLNGRAAVTVGIWEETLLRHPQYPSLQSISDSLQKWGFDNAALHLVPEQLAELPFPFIAHLVEDRGKFISVLDRQKEQLLTTDGHTQSWIPLYEFERSWSGVVLLLEAKERYGDPDYKNKRIVEFIQLLRYPILIALVGLLVTATLLFYPVATLQAWLHLVLSLVGLGLSIALVSIHIEGTNSPARVLCKTSGKINCDDVLHSPAATLFGIVSWAELGILYYGFQLIGLLISLINGQVTDTLTFLAILNILSLLYVPYSIFYQAIVIKRWCRLCLGVQAVLLVHAGIAIPILLSNKWFSLPYVPFLWGAILPSLTWILVKPIWIIASKWKETSQNLHRFQSNEVLFAELLNQQTEKPPLPIDMPVFRYGDPSAPHVLTIISNPFCKPCALAHRKIEHLLAINPFIQVEYIILPGSSLEDKRTRIAAHWLAYASTGKNVHEAMSSWYHLPGQELEKYFNQYPAESTHYHLELVVRVLEWANRANITSTPTYFINGRAWPEVYRLDDLEYLLIGKIYTEID
jgi:uncharacterized membrane protein